MTASPPRRSDSTDRPPAPSGGILAGTDARTGDDAPVGAPRTSWERLGVAAAILATAGIVAVHAVNAMLGSAWPTSAWPSALQLAWLAGGVTLAATLAAARSRSGLAATLAGGAAGTGLAFAAALAAGGGHFAWVLVPWGAGAAAAARAITRRLPLSLDGIFRRRRLVAVAWTALALVTVTQTARLSTYMADPTYDWVLTTEQEFWSRHACMAAYFYAADLDRQGEPNVYAAEHYPGLNPDAPDRTTVANLTPDDPYQYPPQFLLLPRLAIELSNDYLVIRPVWFALQALGFGLVAFLLARRIGGRAGRWAAWLVPALWISVPSMLNFQYGQFHVTAIALAVGAFLAFDRKRAGLGGALLATAIITKGFPGIVLIPMLAARRWRDLASTAAWGIGLTGLSLAVLGPDPFVAFFEYHLPRLRSGEAFAFHEAWPDFAELLFAGNVSPQSLVQKLDALGLPGMGETTGRILQAAFSLMLAVFAWFSARVKDRTAQAVSWLALINLASLTSPAAWGDYVPVGTLWIVLLLAADLPAFGRRTAIAVAALGAFCFLLPGVVPLGNWPGPQLSMVFSILCTLALIAGNAWAVARAPLPAAAPARDRPRRKEPSREFAVDPA